MASKVYFSDFRSRNSKENKISKIKKLFKAANFENNINKKDLTAIKIHFGEKGNDSYINPVFVRQIVDMVKKAGANPFLTDTNTLYYGSRHNAVDHLNTAILHGFDYAVAGAPLVIADGIRGENEIEIEINLKHFKTAKIAGDIEKADSMIVLSHFKGHGMSGFGGAIKNLAMGCASPEGKLEQHECVKPTINEKCIGCGKCIASCPVSAMIIEGNRSQINYEVCIACNNCFMVCPESVIDLEWENIGMFIEKMTEYAYGAVKNKQDKVCYINFLMDITPDCDCVPWSDAPIVPDIGILASHDPVALDTASYHLVNQQCGFKNSSLGHNHEKGEDKFKGLYKKIEGDIQMKYGEEIDLGTMDYDLIRI
ncbi:DUF362 domain-containing protein [Methanobacterium sp. ACI-7]|uniref:DUF362 domain-containing protein n=1 Tax=unclassified Methanobacterium TaxID=2627676 RepID=UPI0039C4351B